MFKHMSTAPRDGTIIEIKCSYGIMPWYALGQYIDGELRQYPDSMKGWTNENSLSWREFDGDPENYVDPTNGAQWTYKYWGGTQDGSFE